MAPGERTQRLALVNAAWSLLETAPRIGRALALVGMLLTGGCTSAVWQTCAGSPYMPSGILGSPVETVASTGLYGLALSICAAVVQVKVSHMKEAQP